MGSAFFVLTRDMENFMFSFDFFGVIKWNWNLAEIHYISGNIDITTFWKCQVYIFYAVF